MDYDLSLDIYKYGEYFNPAISRYDTPVHDNNGVGCDRCDKTPLLSCISWREYDLCMECIHEIEKSLEKLLEESDE